MHKTHRLSWQAKLVGGALRVAAPPMTARERLMAFQDELTKLDAPPADCPLQHSFIDGVYVRTIFIPAGTVLVGKIHKHSHANILSKGEVVVMTEDGGREHLVGPLTMTSPAGCKRAVHALTDATWTTIHRTDEKDLEKIEDWVIAKTYEEYEQFKLEGSAMQQIEVKP